MLSKSTEYAIRALVFIQMQNWKGEHPGVSLIAKEIQAPEPYTAKILQTLTKNELLISMKGRGGGFFFFDNNSTSTIYDVIHIMEGDACFTKCGFGLVNCTNESPCPIHAKYIEIRTGFYDIVKSETIKKFAERILEGEAVLNRVLKDNKN